MFLFPKGFDNHVVDVDFHFVANEVGEHLVDRR